jgi:hypothetical protein
LQQNSFFLFDISLKIGSADKNKQQPKRKMHTQILALTIQGFVSLNAMIYYLFILSLQMSLQVEGLP